MNPGKRCIELTAQVTEIHRVAFREKCQIEERAREAAKPLLAEIDEIEKPLREKAFELAKALGKAPFHTWGDRMDPHRSHADEHGMWLIWDIYDNGPPETFHATWEALGIAC